jgi:hypothetical protein
VRAPAWSDTRARTRARIFDKKAARIFPRDRRRRARKGEFPMNVRRTVAAGIAALTLVTASASLAFAQDRMSGGKMQGAKMQGGKMMAGKMVYACKDCKMYFSAADARKMKMKDPMGHKMTRMSMASARRMGMKMGNAKMMSGDKMRDEKMMHGDSKMRGGNM